MTSNHRNSRKRRRWILFGVITLVVLVGGFYGLSAALRPNNQVDPSKLASVTRGDLARSVVATGKIQPRTKVEVKSKASGIVKQILVDYGTLVKQDQVLAELDKEDLRVRVREANAIRQAAEAALESAQAADARNQVEAGGPGRLFLEAVMER